MPTIDFENLWLLITQSATNWGLKLVSAIAIFIIGRLVARWGRKAVRLTLGRSGVDETLVPFMASMAYYAVMTIVIIAVLGAVGIQTASLVAVLGAAGLAIGLALQGTLGHLASGVMLLMFRPFRKGDAVEAGGVVGTVEAIGIFNTTFNTVDNVRIVIPNSAVWGDTIKNFTANPTRRIDLLVGISYADDIALAFSTIQRVLAGDSRVLAEPEPIIAVHELADSSVNLVVRPWSSREDYWPLRWDLTRRIKEELERAGCSIPYPQRDVHLIGEGAGRAA